MEVAPRRERSRPIGRVLWYCSRVDRGYEEALTQVVLPSLAKLGTPFFTLAVEAVDMMRLASGEGKGRRPSIERVPVERGQALRDLLGVRRAGSLRPLAFTASSSSRPETHACAASSLKVFWFSRRPG